MSGLMHCDDCHQWRSIAKYQVFAIIGLVAVIVGGALYARMRFDVVPGDVLSEVKATHAETTAQVDSLNEKLKIVSEYQTSIKARVSTLEDTSDRFRGADMDAWIEQERARTGEPISPWRETEE